MAFISIAATLVFIFLATGAAEDECPLREHMICAEQQFANCPQRKSPNSQFQRCTNHSECPCTSLCCSFPGGCETQCVVPDIIDFYGHHYTIVTTKTPKIESRLDPGIPSENRRNASLPVNRYISGSQFLNIPELDDAFITKLPKMEPREDAKVYFPFQTTHEQKRTQLPSENANRLLSKNTPPPVLQSRSFNQNNDNTVIPPAPEKKPILSGFYNYQKKTKADPKNANLLLQTTAPTSTVWDTTLIPISRPLISIQKSTQKQNDFTSTPPLFTSARDTTASSTTAPTSPVTYTTFIPISRASISSPKNTEIYSTLASILFTPAGRITTSTPSILPDFTNIFQSTANNKLVNNPLTDPKSKIVPPFNVDFPNDNIKTTYKEKPYNVITKGASQPIYMVTESQDQRVNPAILNQFPNSTAANLFPIISKDNTATNIPRFSKTAGSSLTRKSLTNEKNRYLDKELSVKPKNEEDNISPSTSRTSTDMVITESPTVTDRHIYSTVSNDVSTTTTATTRAIIPETFSASITPTPSTPSTNEIRDPEVPQIQFRSGSGSDPPVDHKDFRDLSERIGLTVPVLLDTTTIVPEKDIAFQIPKSDISPQNYEQPHGLIAKLLSHKNKAIPSHERTSTYASNMQELPTDVNNVNRSQKHRIGSTETPTDKSDLLIKSAEDGTKSDNEADESAILARSGSGNNDPINAKNIYRTIDPIVNDTTKKHPGSEDNDVVTKKDFLNGLEKLSKGTTYSDILSPLARSSVQSTTSASNGEITSSTGDTFKIESFKEDVNQHVRAVRGNETIDVVTVSKNILKSYGNELKNESFYLKKTVSKVLKPLMEAENESIIYEYKKPSLKIGSTQGSTSTPRSINKAESFQSAGSQARSAGFTSEKSDHVSPKGIKQTTETSLVSTSTLATVDTDIESVLAPSRSSSLSNKENDHVPSLNKSIGKTESTQRTTLDRTTSGEAESTAIKNILPCSANFLNKESDEMGSVNKDKKPIGIKGTTECTTLVPKVAPITESTEIEDVLARSAGFSDNENDDAASENKSNKSTGVKESPQSTLNPTIPAETESSTESEAILARSAGFSNNNSDHEAPVNESSGIKESTQNTTLDPSISPETESTAIKDALARSAAFSKKESDHIINNSTESTQNTTLDPTISPKAVSTAIKAVLPRSAGFSTDENNSENSTMLINQTDTFNFDESTKRKQTLLVKVPLNVNITNDINDATTNAGNISNLDPDGKTLVRSAFSNNSEATTTKIVTDNETIIQHAINNEETTTSNLTTPKITIADSTTADNAALMPRNLEGDNISNMTSSIKLDSSQTARAQNEIETTNVTGFNNNNVTILPRSKESNVNKTEKFDVANKNNENLTDIDSLRNLNETLERSYNSQQKTVNQSLNSEPPEIDGANTNISKKLAIQGEEFSNGSGISQRSASDTNENDTTTSVLREESTSGDKSMLNASKITARSESEENDKKNKTQSNVGTKDNTLKEEFAFNANKTAEIENTTSNLIKRSNGAEGPPDTLDTTTDDSVNKTLQDDVQTTEAGKEPVNVASKTIKTNNKNIISTTEEPNNNTINAKSNSMDSGPHYRMPYTTEKIEKPADEEEITTTAGKSNVPLENSKDVPEPTKRTTQTEK